MGLDMYLEKRNKNMQDAKYEEIAYWRKANQIREWFDKHVGVENCKYVIIEKNMLIQLKNDCMKVLSDHSKATELLPTSSGFFFGSTDYDEYYFEDLEETVDMLTKIISETDWETEEVAYYEWW